MKLRLTSRAARDLEAIMDHLEAERPAGRRAVQAEIDEGLLTVKAFPRAGRQLAGRVRRLALPKYPYLIFYRIDEQRGSVVVLSVRHGARNPPIGWN